MLQSLNDGVDSDVFISLDLRVFGWAYSGAEGLGLVNKSLDGLN